jgi:carboxypeptidase Taq
MISKQNKTRDQINKSLEILNLIDNRFFELRSIESLLDWDRATSIPKKAIEQRAKHTELISGEIHKLFTDKKLSSAIKILRKKENYEKLSKKNKRKVDVYYKKIRQMTKLPSRFVKELSNLQSISQSKWEEAKEKNDFKIFQPYLEKIINMYRKRAKLLGHEKNTYDSLIDEYEEGLTTKEIDKVFYELKKDLKELINKIKNSKKFKEQNKLSKKILKQKYSKEDQEITSLKLSKLILGNEDRWKISISTHPFTTRISEDDVRITTAFRKNPNFSISSTIHESGHALFELGMNSKLKGILLESPSYGLHESQSRFWENNIGLNKNFWKFFYKELPPKFKKTVSCNEWYRFINQVKPSLIRIESDEVTYPFHIIIRYELEKELFDGRLKVKDLPKRWNEKYFEYLGIKPKNYSEGILQDVHWSMGSFGYFPTYIVGTIYATIIYNHLLKINKNLPLEIRSGDFSNVKTWLNKNIHKYGNTMSAKEIIKKATGEELNSKDFTDYLNNKYKKIYDIK